MNIEQDFEYWVDSLFEEGYDLSNYTWEGLFEYFCENVLSEALGGYDGSNEAEFNKKITAAVRAGRYSTPSGGPIAPEATSAIRDVNAERIRAQEILNRNPKIRGTLPGGSVVLAKQGEQEGKLDKGTGIFTAGKFNKDEASRFNRVNKSEIQKGLKTYNTLRTSTKPEDQARVKQVGMDVWRRSNPGLAARLDANRDRAAGTSSAERQNTAVTNYISRGFSRPGNERPGYQGPPTPGTSSAPVPTTDSRTMPTTRPQLPKSPIAGREQMLQRNLRNSFDFSSPSKVASDMAYLYQSIYEGKKKVDQDMDGDNDFADVMIARMVAAGVPRAEAIRRVRNKEYNV